MAYNTYISYRDNNSWTSERGASKIISNIFLSEGIGKGDGGCVINGFKPVQNPEGADFNICIKAQDSLANIEDGHCIITYDDYCYVCWLASDYLLEMEGSSMTLNRISYIVAYVDRDIMFVESDKIEESPDVLKIVEVKGTESNSPVEPTKTQIQNVVGINNPYIILAKVNIPANTSSLTNSNITDLRKMAKLSPDLRLDPDNSYAAGVYQCAPNSGVKTRLVVTGPNAATPAAIPGVQVVWIRKKA